MGLKLHGESQDLRSLGIYCVRSDIAGSNSIRGKDYIHVLSVFMLLYR